jgi:hypothetical protein
MKRKGLLKQCLGLAIGLALLAAASVAEPPGHIPKRMIGTWLAGVEITLEPGTDPIYLPEIGTFERGGTAIYSSGFPPLALPFDQTNGELVTYEAKAGQGSWIYKAGRFVGTQWRILVEVSTGIPLGFSKLTSEWQLIDRNTGQGMYRAEVLQPDFSPYTIGGQPVVFEGNFELFRLPTESLP